MCVWNKFRFVIDCAIMKWTLELQQHCILNEFQFIWPHRCMCKPQKLDQNWFLCCWLRLDENGYVRHCFRNVYIWNDTMSPWIRPVFTLHTHSQTRSTSLMSLLLCHNYNSISRWCFVISFDLWYSDESLIFLNKTWPQHQNQWAAILLKIAVTMFR